MFIYRDEYYNKDSKEPGVAEIVIGKAAQRASGHREADLPGSR